MENSLVLSKIFSYLSLNQLLQLRLVCKEWHDFINHFEQREALCLYKRVVPHKLKWISDGALVRETIKVQPSKLDLKDPFLRNIKRLFIYETAIPGLLESLSHLTKLEELHFYLDYHIAHIPFYLRGPVKLCLKNLKVLKFCSIFVELILDAPKLEFLRIDGSSDEIHFVHPNSIQTLICSFALGRERIEWFNFPNLRRLVIGLLPINFRSSPINFRSSQINFRFDLKDFPQLKVVELYTQKNERNYSVMNFAQKLKEQRSLLGRDDLQILVNGFRDNEIGFRMVETAFIDQINLSAVSNNLDKMVADFEFPASFRFEEYQLLQPYCPSMDAKKKCFLKKFKMITEIKAEHLSDSTDSSELFEFLSEFGDCVKNLHLKNYAPFFDAQQLIAFQSIRQLYVSEFKVKTNYKVLLDLKNLEKFGLSTFPHLILFSSEIVHFAVELFEKKPIFKTFGVLNYKIRRSMDGPGLTYNRRPFRSKTPEDIFTIFLKLLSGHSNYNRWCELFGDDYLAKYDLLPCLEDRTRAKN